MTTIRANHRFFPVGQGLFAAGSVEVHPTRPSRGRKLDLGDRAKSVTYRWVYDCGSSTAKRLVANAIDNLKREAFGERIDLLTLSHFHNDHVSGVVDILKEIGAKTVMLPWAPLWHRLLIGFDQGLRASDPEMQFFVDPVQYLDTEAGDGFERVLFVMPSEGDGPPVPDEPVIPLGPPEGPETVEKERGSGDDPAVLDELDLSDRRVAGRLQILRPGQSIPVLGVWEFVPYNDPATRPSDPTGFEKKVKAYRPALLQGSDRERRDALDDLRALYERTFGRSKMNDVSLMLYGGEVGNWHCEYRCEFNRIHYRLLRRWGYRDEPRNKSSVLLTGDGNLSNAQKWTSLERYLDSRRAIGTCVFQVPHHGARANWHEGLADIVTATVSIFSSDPRHNYGHPHAEVIRDFWTHNPVQVDQHSGFAIKVWLGR